MTYGRHCSTSLPGDARTGPHLPTGRINPVGLAFQHPAAAGSLPACRDRVAYVPNGADDLFFEPVTDNDRARVRADLGLPERVPYLLSVANFQKRKNLVRLIHAAARLPEVAAGDLALVLIGTGAEARPDCCARRPPPSAAMP